MTSIITPHQVWLPFRDLGSFLTYALGFSLLYAFDTSPSMPQSRQDIYVWAQKIFHSGIICKLSTCQGMRFIILERHLVTKSELLVGCNQISSLVKTSASSLVLVRVYWLDDKGSPLECYWVDDKGALLEYHWVDSKGLTPASYHYARVVARWLEVLASYAG